MNLGVDEALSEICGSGPSTINKVSIMKVSRALRFPFCSCARKGDLLCEVLETASEHQTEEVVMENGLELLRNTPKWCWAECHEVGGTA